MSEIIYKRNSELEMRKVFRFYDNDDDGSISKDNIWQAADALDLENELNEENVAMMIEMGDPKRKESVNEIGFLKIMKECGLVLPPYVEPVPPPKDNSDFERAVKLLEEQKKRAEDKAELMSKKSAMGATPLFN